MKQKRSDRCIGIILKGYPRISETFIAQEIRELERLGFSFELISLRHPTDTKTHPVHQEITAPVHYLPEYMHNEPGRVFRAWRAARGLPGYREAVRAFLKDLRRDFTRNRVRRFGQAMVLATEYAPRLSFFYVHFIHTPASVARYASAMTGIPFAVSAHAKDIWTTPGWELKEKLADANWCVTCTKGGRDELASHAPDAEKVHLVYHGIDFSRFPCSPEHTRRDGSQADEPVQLLSVGRAVAKKGFDNLLEALAQLPPDLHWRWTHIGGGPLRDDLRAQADDLGIAQHCAFRGSLAQEEVLQAYRASDLFILPCRIDETGDRDGLPNVIVEAQSQALAVLTTPLSGIPELIEDKKNGVFIEPDQPEELAQAIDMLCREPEKRIALGLEGERRVRADFDHHTVIGDLADLLG